MNGQNDIKRNWVKGIGENWHVFTLSHHHSRTLSESFTMRRETKFGENFTQWPCLFGEKFADFFLAHSRCQQNEIKTTSDGAIRTFVKDFRVDSNKKKKLNQKIFFVTDTWFDILSFVCRFFHIKILGKLRNEFRMKSAMQSEIHKFSLMLI